MEILPIKSQDKREFNTTPLIPLTPATTEKPTVNSSVRRMRAMEAIELAKRTALPPICTVDFRSEDIKINKAEIELSGVDYNDYYGNSWRFLFPEASYLQITADFHKDPNRSYALNLNHLSSLVDEEPLAKITIEVNGQTVITGYNPNNGDYCWESFDITPYVVDGKNTIRISLDSDAGSQYWIQSLSIQAK